MAALSSAMLRAAEAATITLRPAVPSDAAALAAFGARVFFDTFGADPKHRPEDMAVYLAEAFAPATVAAEIEDSANRFVLAILPTGGIVGYTKVRLPEAPGEVPDCVPPTPDGSEPAELCRLYVDHSLHGTGVANQLMGAALALVREAGRTNCWLGVYEPNVRARRFYTRWGFTEVGEHPFLFASDLQTDIVMVRVESAGP